MCHSYLKSPHFKKHKYLRNEGGLFKVFKINPKQIDIQRTAVDHLYDCLDLLKYDKSKQHTFDVFIMSGDQEQKLEVMIAISKAIVSKNEPCTTVTFLEKFYKRSLSNNNKINEVRLARFNALLYKVCQNFSTMSQSDLQVVFAVLLCFVNKITTFSPDEEKLRILSATYHWIGQLLPIAAEHSAEAAVPVVELLEYLLKAKRLQVMKLQDYVALLVGAETLKKSEITAEQQTKANAFKTDSVIIEDIDETSALLKHTNLLRLFRDLIRNHSDLKTVIELLLICSKKVSVGNRFDFVWTTVLGDFSHSDTDQIVKIIEYLLQKGDFDIKGKHRLNKASVQIRAGTFVAREFNSSAIYNGLPDNVAKVVEPNVLKQLIQLKDCDNRLQSTIEIFQNDKQSNYIPLYLILKSNCPIPKAKLNELFDRKELSNRRAIIIAFMFTQQKKMLAHDLLKLYSQIKQPTKAQRIRALYYLHFALQPPNQAQLLAKIMEQIPADKLNELSTFSFLSLLPLDRAKFDKGEKSLIVTMLSQQTEANDHIYRVKIDLSTAVGESNALLTSMENVVKHMSRRTDEMIESLLTINDDTLLELILMKINRMFESKHIGEINAKLVQWTFKTHAKQIEKYKKAVHEYFVSINKEELSNLALALKSWNIASKQPIKLPELEPFMNVVEREHITDDNYVNFLIKIKNSTLLEQCMRAESRIRELETFIGFLDEKHYGRKEFKKIIENYNTPQMFLLQALHYYSQANINQPQLLKGIIAKLSTDSDVQEQAEKKLQEYWVDFEGIEYYFEFMLNQAPQEALSFICKLIKSKSPKDQKKGKHKKSRKKEKEESKDLPTRLIESFLDCLPLVLKEPQKLTNFQELIQTIDKLIKLKWADDSMVPHLVTWVSHFKSIPMVDYENICLNVANLRSFWTSAEKLLSDRIQRADIEVQIEYMTSLISSSRQYSNKPKYEEVYNNLLSIVHILYSLQHSQQMEGEGVAKVPRHKLKALPEKYRIRPSNEGMYFYCETCTKNVCQSCANFMHRNHDKTYVNRDKGTCNHQTDQRKHKQKERTRAEEELQQLHKMEMFGMADPDKLIQFKRFEKERERRQRQRERERQRQYEAMKLKEQITYTYQTNSKQVNPASINSQTQPNEDTDNMQIKSTTEKSIVQNISKCNAEFSDPVFVQLPPEGSEGPSNKISMAPLMTELMQSIQRQGMKRCGEKEIDGDQGSCIEKFSFDSSSMQVVMEAQNQKYIMFKINGSRGGPEDIEYDKRSRSYGSTRTLMSSNGRIMAVKNQADGADIIMFYHEVKLRRSLKKREKGKKFAETETEGNFAIERRFCMAFEVVSMTFCKKNPNLLLVCGENQFQIFIVYEGKEFKKTSYPNLMLGGEKIIKALWIPGSSTRIALAVTKEIKIYEISDVSSNPNLRVVTRYQSANPIYDLTLSNHDESSEIFMYVCDQEGGLFREVISFQDEGIQALTNLVVATGLDSTTMVSSFMMSPQSDLCMVAFREGSNVLCRLRDNTISKIMDMRLQLLISQRSEYYSVLDRSGHVVSDAKLIFESKDAAIITCLLRKPNQNTGGNLAIIQLSKANSIHIQVVHGNFRTQGYDVIPYDDEGQSERFIIIGIQHDGTLWLKPYEVRISLTQTQKQQDLTQDRIEQFNHLIQKKHLLSYIGNGGGRRIDFKEISAKLNSVNMNEVPEQKLQIGLSNNVFVTGIVIRIDAPSLVSFNMFDQDYEFNVKQPRELQIPFSLKQTLQTFVSRTISININRKYAVQVYVMSLDKPSIYYDAYRELVKIYTNNYGFSKKDAVNYFSNAGRSDFMNISQDSITKLFKENKLEQPSINFVLEMQLLIQALDRNGMSLSMRQIEEFLISVKRFLLIDRPIIKTSVNRLFRKIFWLYRIISERQGKSISLGDAFDYFTFKDLFWTEKLFRDFLNKSNLWKLDQLLDRLHHLKYKRLANLYLMFAVFPKMMIRICEFYRKELENCSETSRHRMNDRIAIIIRLLCEYYQYNKNRGNVDSQIQTFYILELLLSGMSKNKELYKDIILRVFYCFEAIPIVENPIEFSYGCRLFEVTSCPMDKNVALPLQIQEEDPIEPQEEFKHEQSEEDSQMRPQEDVEWHISRRERIQPISQDSPDIIIPERSPPIYNKLLNESDLTKLIADQRNHNVISITYYDFIYELTISLFRIESRVRRENSSLYIGLLFNLMGLLDLRINHYRTETAYRMIRDLMEAVNRRLITCESQSLFIVMAHFMEPNYDEMRKNGKPVDVANECKKLKKYILRYYKETGNYEEHIKSLLTQKLPPPKTRCLTLKEAFFNEVQINTNIYQIKYLGNLYLNLIMEKLTIKDPRFKQYILKGYVKDKLRVFKNIIILQGWKDQLQNMKFTAAFEQLKQGDYENGFARLENAAKKQPSALVNYITTDFARLQFLESLLSNLTACRHYSQLMEVLSLFYKTI